jgi:hypothetical protein
VAVVYDATLKNTRLSDVVTALGATAHLIFMDAASVVLADIALANPVGAVAAGVLTFTMPQSATVGTTGTVAKAKLTDGTNDVITGLTVGTSGADINFNGVNWTSGDTATMNSLSITAG